MKHSTQQILAAGKVLKDVIRTPYAWPGGYDRSLLIGDAILCPSCVKERFQEELWEAAFITLPNGTLAVDCLWEGDHTCEHCSKNVTVYGEVEA